MKAKILFPIVMVAIALPTWAVDSDSDGLDDSVETNTGVFVSAADTGTAPDNPDSDDDGAGDWYEVAASFTDPNEPGDNPGIPYPLPGPDGSGGTADKPVKVYIMGGDSAMFGWGTVFGTEPGTLDTIVYTENKFPNLKDGSGGWVTRDDVLVHSFGTNNSNINKQLLRPIRDRDYFGPELGFGHVMGWYHDEPVLLIRAANGNRALGWDLLPPGRQQFDWTDGRTYAGYGESPESWVTGSSPSPIFWHAGKEFDDYFLDEADMGPALGWEDGKFYPFNIQIRHNGVIYRCKADHTATADSEPGVGVNWQVSWIVYSVNNTVDFLDNFATEYPQWAEQGFEIAGYVWWQGRRDTQTAAHVGKYEENLVQLINQLRQYYATRYPGRASLDAPFVVATEAIYGWGQTGNFLGVANAQLAVDGATGDHPDFAGNVRVAEARGYWRNAGQSPVSGDPYNYNHNAETFVLAGDALGRAMLSLINPDSDGDGIADSFETNTGSYNSPYDTGTDPNNPDSDEDGLSDGEEVYHVYNYSPNPTLADTDGDNFLDGYEIYTGHSPTDSDDRPALVANIATAVEFWFPSELGKSYRIESSTDLDQWDLVEGDIAGTGAEIRRFYTTRNEPRKHFRVEEEVP